MAGTNRRTSFAEIAKHRLDARPLLPSPELDEHRRAKEAFTKALIIGDYPTARAAGNLMVKHMPRAGRRTYEERRRSQGRARFVFQWLEAVRERRYLVERGLLVVPALTPDQQREAAAVRARLQRWLGGDESAGPFEWPADRDSAGLPI
jgi:hypothetical protein